MSRSKTKQTWLKTNTTTKKLLIFAIIFAVVGGGFYAYKSKAAGVNFDAGQLFLPADQSAVQTTDCHSSKGCTNVVTVHSPNGNVSASVPVNFSKATGVFFCVNVRGQISNTGKTAPIFTGRDNSSAGTVSGTPAGGLWQIPQSTTYHEYCMGETVNPGPHTLGFRYQNVGVGGSDVYVSYVAVRW